MASEDSDELVSGLAMVHRLGDLHDLEQTASREMASVVHHPHDVGELLEVLALRRPQRMLPEERNDRPDEILAALHDVLDQVFAMVVVAPVLVDPAYSEEAMKLLQAGTTTRTLHHHEPMNDLVAELVGASAPSAGLAGESDREASFSVYKPDDPATELAQPFLLIVRTGRIVTAHDRSLGSVPDGYTGFPAFGRMHTALLPMRGAAIVRYLRTVPLCYGRKTLSVSCPASASGAWPHDRP
jgi:hypothetical protein